MLHEVTSNIIFMCNSEMSQTFLHIVSCYRNIMLRLWAFMPKILRGQVEACTRYRWLY